MEDGQCEREDQGDDRVEERIQAGFDQAGSCQDREHPILRFCVDTPTNVRG
jgi:hypothetical protein